MGNHQVKILAIDDNPDNLVSIKALIYEAYPRASVLIATSGKVGIELAKAEDPDLILLDVLMPIMDGFQVCQQLKSDHRLRDIPVVFITAIKGDKETRIKALDVGAEAFLSKPIDISELTAQIRAMIKIKTLNTQKRTEKEELTRLIEQKTFNLKKEIAERRQIEDHLRASEEKYRIIAENVSDVIWVYNITDNRVTYISPSVQQQRGLTVEEAMAENFEESLTPESYLKMKTALSTSVSRFIQNPMESNNSIIELQQPCKDGSLIWVEVSSSFRIDDNGRIEILGISRNINERKNAERQLREAKQLAEEANIAKGQFLANMSHEIRTPMNGVLGSLQLLEMTSLSSDQYDLIHVSKQSSDALLRVINDILDYSKIEAGQVKIEKISFDLYEFVSDIEKMFRLTATRCGLVFTIEIDPSIPRHLIGDSFRMRQVLSNLLGNAIKFTPAGEIGLRIISKTRDDQAIELEWNVWDTGIGIQDSDFESIFNSFSQADNTTTRKYGGTGLGLSISKGLVELMGGKIGVESYDQKGSRFYFTSPMAVDLAYDIVETGKANDHDSCNPVQALQLLVVEDDEISRFVIERFARTKGWKVRFAMNGEEAVQIFQETTFDAILMDVQMAVMDGYIATAQIREIEQVNQQRTPIIAMTALALKGDREKCFAAGMDDYLTKPINIHDFSLIVEKWCCKPQDN